MRSPPPSPLITFAALAEPRSVSGPGLPVRTRADAAAGSRAAAINAPANARTGRRAGSMPPSSAPPSRPGARASGGRQDGEQPRDRRVEGLARLDAQLGPLR